MSSMTTMEAWADPPGRECPMKGTLRRHLTAWRFKTWLFNNCKENYSTSVPRSYRVFAKSKRDPALRCARRRRCDRETLWTASFPVLRLLCVLVEG